MLKLTSIPAFTDNYIWCVYNEQSKDAVVVDPGCADTVSEYIETNNLNLTGILVTHHHADHTGGIEKLCATTGASTYGFSQSRYRNIQHTFSDSDRFNLLGTSFTVIEVPGHTLDHIAFYSAPDQQHNEPWLFCGDTLFSGGCGRLFEGSPQQMLQSLHQLKELPGNTLVCCAHEYTLANLRFAKSLMPANPELTQYAIDCQEMRNQNIPTLPSTLEQELKINPFLREHDLEIISTLKIRNELESETALDVWTAIRKAKDSF